MQTVERQWAAQLEIKASQFLAYVMPYGQFEAALRALKSEHSKANHHCTAARWLNQAGQLCEFARDDGEPGGTAGRPMLRVLQGQQLINVGAVVVRYFGGVKLGAGGLTRAYSNAVAQALLDATLVPWVERHQAVFEVPFARTDALEHAVAEHALEVCQREFSQHGVRVTVRGSEPQIEAARAAIFPY